MNIQLKRFFSLLSLLVISYTIFGQQVGSNSPYGRYGLGVLAHPGVGASESMGGISYGLRRSQHVNPGNPASYSKIDTLTFIFDMGVSMQNAIFSDGTNRQNQYNGSLEYIAMQFPLFKNFGGSFGLLPFSKVGYSFGRPRSTTDLVYQESFNGAGGLSQAYAGLAYTPVKYVSIGVNLGYIFGNIEHNRMLPYLEGSSLPRYSTTKYYMRALKYDLGAQFTYPFSKEESLTLGVVYTPGIKTKSDITLFDRNVSSSSPSSTAEVIKSDTLRNQSFAIAPSFGTGLTYTNKNLIAGIDGTYQLWKKSDYPSTLDNMTQDNRFNNYYRINGGVEYVIDPYNRNFFKRMRIRAGASYGNSYTNVQVSNPTTGAHLGVSGYKEYGVTFGLGLPFRDNFNGRISMLNIGLSYTRLQPNQSFMVKEDMLKVSLSMNINEFWFFKRQFD